MPTATIPDDESFERRQRRLMLLAWGVTVLPLIAFAYLSWQSWTLRQQNAAAQAQVESIRAEHDGLARQVEQTRAALKGLNAELTAARATAKHYRDFAGIRIRFYRDSDRAVVQKALASRGYSIDTELGTSSLIDRQPNTIGYGRLVAEEDYRDIAIALVEAGFPLKRIAPAERQPDPKLIQIYASALSDRQCGLLTVEAIRAERTCGVK
jgi:cell division protein FtsB